MTFVGLAACVAVLVFAGISALASLALRPLFREAVSVGEPRGGMLLALRYAPTLLAVSFTGLILPAFVRLEPRHSGERVGPLMIALAGMASLALLAGPIRGLRSAVATGRLARQWRSGATSIPLPGAPVPAFAIDGNGPPVALIGILRPRLYVTRRVLRQCTGQEMTAIVAHEAVHYRRRDNLKRLLLWSCPDFLSLTASAGELERAWSESCDLVADDHAARRGLRLDLAAALVKVARAPDAPAVRADTLAAYCCGQREDVQSRVRRLLHPAPSPCPRRPDRVLTFLLAGSVAAGVLLGQSPMLRPGIHGVAEAVVRLLQ